MKSHRKEKIERSPQRGTTGLLSLQDRTCAQVHLCFEVANVTCRWSWPSHRLLPHRIICRTRNSIFTMKVLWSMAYESKHGTTSGYNIKIKLPSSPFSAPIPANVKVTNYQELYFRTFSGTRHVRSHYCTQVSMKLTGYIQDKILRVLFLQSWMGTSLDVGIITLGGGYSNC